MPLPLYRHPHFMRSVRHRRVKKAARWDEKEAELREDVRSNVRGD